MMDLLYNLSKNTNLIGNYKSGRKILCEQDFLNKIPEDIIPLQKYKGCEYPILFKHISCNYIWNTKPKNIMYKKRSCPKCAEYGFSDFKHAWFYCIYFKEIE